MKILYVENNLASFLTAVHYAYYVVMPDLITSDCASFTMLDEIIELEADLELARKVKQGIIGKVGHSGYKEISDAYLSHNTEKEQIIFGYLKILFAKGKAVFDMHSEPAVMDFEYLLKKVRHEVHRMHGFLRFQEMKNGIYYCYFGADNDILELILPHFTARFNSQKFVLHDIKRKKLAYFDGKKCHLMPACDVNITLSDKEEMFRSLWKKYFNNVTIRDRENPRLQTQFAPKKYRWFMNEF